MRLLLSMGLVPDGRPGGALRPCLRWLDPDTGAVTDALAPDVPEAVHPGPREHAECTGAHLDGDVLVQATRTEVLRLRMPDLAVLERFSHPLFHDVHDACPLPDGGVAVSATGHDGVLVLDRQRRLVAHHRVGPHPAPHVRDFRGVPFDRYKPHAFHPNHLFLLDGELWVTGLEARAAVCVTAPREPFRLGAPAHDGRLRDGLLWFTTVDGLVLAFDPVTRALVHRLDLPALAPSPRLFGWCRALEKVGDRLFVGVTMLRTSRSREVLRVALRGERGRKRPTRVVEVDLSGPRVVAEHPVGNEAGGTIYAITAWPRPAAAAD